MDETKEIRTIWIYKVKAEHCTQFQKIYGSNGDWAKLFKKCPGFIKTDLQRDSSDPNQFMTIDYWESYEHFANMKRFIATEYRLLDKLCEEFTTSEQHIGIFECLDDN